MFSPSAKLAATAVVILISLAVVSAECTREGLLAAAESYLAAQTSGSTDGLPLSATNFTYQLNNKVSDIKTGVLSQPLKIDLNRSTADTISAFVNSNQISST
ncbi:hypothetical protein F4819DRAFT_328920 [Hypoxylon fuscum]|nr:hypothetical protein F4819DRAFT_328920 [Hypoxylon fuscum]